MCSKQIITIGKKGIDDNGARERAAAFLLKPVALSKLFTTFASRYSERPGGYTRIHKFGNRQGDNAPHAILELVDNPRDLRWEMTSRAIGRETSTHKLKQAGTHEGVSLKAHDILRVVNSERNMGYGQKGILRPMTRWNLQKILRFRPSSAPQVISEKAASYTVRSSLSSPYFCHVLTQVVGRSNGHPHGYEIPPTGCQGEESCRTCCPNESWTQTPSGLPSRTCNLKSKVRTLTLSPSTEEKANYHHGACTERSRITFIELICFTSALVLTPVATRISS